MKQFLVIILLLPVLGISAHRPVVFQNKTRRLGASPATNQHCDFTNPKDRENCGFPGITPAQCQERRCCFDDSIAGVNWCFKRSTKFECVASQPENREQCGYAGISREECKERRCCFNDAVPGVHWCFYGRYFHKCDYSSPHNRYECGYPGITREECEQRSCCFDDSIVGVKWCFHKTRDPCVFLRKGPNNAEFDQSRNDEASSGFLQGHLNHMLAIFHHWFSKE